MEKQEAGFDIAAAFADLMSGQAEGSENPLEAFTPTPPSATPQRSLAELPRVFDNGLDYARAALRWFSEKGEPLDGAVDNGALALTAPEDLKQRLKYLPREVRPEQDRFVLTPDIARVNDAIQRSRQEEDAAWPAIHYLWSLHPVMEWLADRTLNAFGRHTAPVLRLPDRMAADEHIVLIHGGYPNRRGHLLVQDWVGIVLRAGQVQEQLDWPALQQRLRFISRQDSQSWTAWQYRQRRGAARPGRGCGTPRLKKFSTHWQAR